MTTHSNEKFLSKIFANKGSGHIYRQCLDVIQAAINKGNQKIEIKIVECADADSVSINDLIQAATQVANAKSFEESERAMKKLRQVLRVYAGSK